MFVSTRRVSTCLPEKSLLRWKLQLPLDRLEARLLAQEVEPRVYLYVFQLGVLQAHRRFEP